MNYKKNLNDIIDKFKSKLASIRTDRPSIGMVSDILVELPTGSFTLNKLSSISASGRSIFVTVWDFKSRPAIEKALRRESYTPIVEMDSIVVNIPPLSGERRDELCSMVRELAEEYKVSVRQVRRKWLDSGASSKDVEAEIKSVVQKITLLATSKEKDILG